MLSNGPFYFSLLRKYQSYFGYLFSNLYFKREFDDSLGQLIKVPIVWGSKNKSFVRTDADPNLAKDTSLTLPRMSYRHTNIRYDASRKLPTTVRIAAKSTDSNKLKTQYTPMPFDIDFELNIVTNQLEDTNRITEQIYPFFTPDWTASLELIPEMNEIRDIPVIYRSTTIDDQFAGPMDANRIIVNTLEFTMKAYFYGPVVDKPIIKFAEENFYFDQNSDKIETISVRPGLLANGSPTSSANDTIDANNIFIDSNFGYIIEANGIIRLTGNT